MSIPVTVEVLGPNLIRFHFQWESDSNGDAAILLDGEDAPRMYGILDRLVTRPGLTAPTDDYDITLEDYLGYDALEGAGTDRDTATPETAWPIDVPGSDTIRFRDVATLGLLEFKVANAGASKAGEAYIYLRVP